MASSAGKDCNSLLTRTSYSSSSFTVPFLLTRNNRVLPRFPEKYGSGDHRVKFGIEFIKYREELIALPWVEGQTTSNAELLDQILDKILVTTIPQVFELQCHDWPREVASLLSICITGNRTKSYEDLLDLISRPRDKPFYTQYLNFYSKIIPNLVKLLREHGIKVSSSPSRKFFCYIIEMYLHEVLGSKEGSPYLKFSMLTCGHEVCSQVNDFLRSEEKEKTIPLVKGVYRCVASLKIDGRHDLFDLKPYRRRKPPCMDLVKKREAMAAQHWSVRLADARALLKSIGTDEEISQIMGERYRDVEKALEGSQAFVVTETGKEEGDVEAMVGIE